MNIRTVLALGGVEAASRRYEAKLSSVYDVLFKKGIISGLMFGLSYLIQYIVFGLLFYFAAIFVTNNTLDVRNVFSAIFLILFAGISAGNNSNFLEDISTARSGAKTIFAILDMDDEHEIRKKAGSKMLK